MSIRPPWHYVLILAIVVLIVAIMGCATPAALPASEWTPAKEPRIVTNIRHVDAPCGSSTRNGCLALNSIKPGAFTWEIQVRRDQSQKCITHVTMHEVKHISHNHQPRAGYFMTDDGLGNMMECPL